MRTAWLIWTVVTLSLGIYFAAGYVAGRVEFVPISLSVGFIANQKLFRFGHDRLRMEWEFGGDHSIRPELGEYRLKPRVAGRLEFPDPGAEIVLNASSNLSETPTPYSALPKTAHNEFHIYRGLVAELKEAPGVWKWPPTNPGLALEPGVNDIRIEVATVGHKLVGENVRLLIHSEIGFKECGSQVCWLWGWFVWPLFLLIQLIWASVLFKSVPGRTAK